MTEVLQVSESRRRAMIEVLEVGTFYTGQALQDLFDDMITAANSIPEGAPVGTIARRPDGAVYAVRSLTNHRNPYWTYVYVDLGNDEPFSEQGDAADSWPVIYDPTEPGCAECKKYAVVGLDLANKLAASEGTKMALEEIVAKCECGADPATQQEPPKGLYGKYRVERMDGKPIRACFVLEYLDDLHANKALLEYAFSVERVNPELAKDLRTEWGKWPGRTTDPTAQQEPETCGVCNGSGVGYGKVSGGLLETDCSDCDATGQAQKESATTHSVSPESTNCVPKPREPRVVDRLGVEERDAEWTRTEISRDTYIWEYRYRGGVWKFRLLGHRNWTALGPGDEPANGPFTEVIE